MDNQNPVRFFFFFLGYTQYLHISNISVYVNIYRSVELYAMGLLTSSLPPMCPGDKHCSEWARQYIKYCLCDVRDGVSLALGLVSVISWGVAEIPQIITNYRKKSTEGLSIAFLMTWIVG